MTIKSATRLVLAAACLTAVGTLATAHAQPAETGGTASGRYWTSPPAYGTPPGAYTAPGAYGSTTGTYTPQTRYVPPPPDQGMPGTQMVTNGPQSNVETASPSWSPRENVLQSQRYDRLVETSRTFREARMRKECGPITDPQLHQQCLDSFGRYEPPGSATGYGASTATRGSRSNYGG
jgi:hypothetical protein